MTLYTLYQSNQEAWDAIGRYRPGIAEMAKHFIDYTSMESALGYGQCVVNKWVRKRGGVAAESERRAQTWLASRKPAPTPAAPVAANGMLLLVSCPDGIAPKAIRLLAVLGCEATEV